MTSHWGGKFKDCDLVVLSACDTQRGVQKGDSFMSLPLGFFFALAPTVIASLWRVDDTATALLMVRMYENLLGTGHVMTNSASNESSDGVQGSGADRDSALSKSESVREAKPWLRGLLCAHARQICGRPGLDPNHVPHCGPTPMTRTVDSVASAQRTRDDSGPAGGVPDDRGVDIDRPVKVETTGEATDHPYDHPYYWAAFILIGDPG